MDFLAYIDRSTYNSIKTLTYSMIDEKSYDNVDIYVKYNYVYNYDSFI